MKSETVNQDKCLFDKETGSEIGREGLVELLKKYDVPFDSWGTGESKTAEHLLSEINLGESDLVEERGILVKKSFVAAINVYYKQGDKIFKLKEAKQIFYDGREKVRDLETSIGEKMRPGESASSAAYRALSEELGIKERIELKPVSPITKGPVASQSFPGLQSKFFINVFEIFLPDSMYKPDGYKEQQADKESIFIWEEIN